MQHRRPVVQARPLLGTGAASAAMPAMRLGHRCVGQPCPACLVPYGEMGGPRITDEHARAVMRLAGVEPFGPYPGGKVPWPSRCLGCDREVAPRYDNVKGGRRGVRLLLGPSSGSKRSSRSDAPRRTGTARALPGRGPHPVEMSMSPLWCLDHTDLQPDSAGTRRLRSMWDSPARGRADPERSRGTCTHARRGVGAARAVSRKQGTLALPLQDLRLCGHPQPFGRQTGRRLHPMRGATFSAGSRFRR